MFKGGTQSRLSMTKWVAVIQAAIIRRAIENLYIRALRMYVYNIYGRTYKRHQFHDDIQGHKIHSKIPNCVCQKIC